jgi:hypothetical protein
MRMLQNYFKTLTFFILIFLSGCSSTGCLSTLEKDRLSDALGRHDLVISELRDALGGPVTSDLLAEYLKQSRVLGYAQTIKAKRKVDDLRKNTFQVLLLVEAIAPNVQENEKTVLLPLKQYLNESVNRIDQLHEIYMLGGEIPLPSYKMPKDVRQVVSRLPCVKG